MKSTSKTVPLWLNIRKKSATHHPTGRWDCVCHGFHSPFHNKMASADALMSTRFICARSRVKPTTETKNNASKVIRVTLKCPTEAQSALGLMEPDQSYQLGFVRWATRAVNGPGGFLGRRGLRASLGGRVGTFSRRQMLTPANMGGTRILKITSPIQK